MVKRVWIWIGGMMCIYVYIWPTLRLEYIIKKIAIANMIFWISLSSSSSSSSNIKPTPCPPPPSKNPPIPAQKTSLKFSWISPLLFWRKNGEKYYYLQKMMRSLGKSRFFFQFVFEFILGAVVDVVQGKKEPVVELIVNIYMSICLVF